MSGALAGLFAYRVKAAKVAGSEPPGTPQGDTNRFAYEPIRYSCDPGYSVMTFTYDPSRPIEPLPNSITTYTYTYSDDGNARRVS
jgi:hypothetical protein